MANYFKPSRCARVSVVEMDSQPFQSKFCTRKAQKFLCFISVPRTTKSRKLLRTSDKIALSTSMSGVVSTIITPQVTRTHHVCGGTVGFLALQHFHVCHRNYQLLVNGAYLTPTGHHCQVISKSWKDYSLISVNCCTAVKSCGNPFLFCNN
jgi:hypothetical protein